MDRFAFKKISPSEIQLQFPKNDEDVDEKMKQKMDFYEF